MDALVLRIGPRHGRGAEYHKFAGSHVEIGRGYHNDLIVADPYLGPGQFRIVRTDGEMFLEILDETNPVLVNGRRCQVARKPLAAGDELTVGHTTIGVFLESTLVPETRLMRATFWSRLGRWQPPAALAVLILTGLCALWVDYLDTVEEIDWPSLLSGPVFLVMIIIGWAMAWATVGRVLRSQPRFFGHLVASAAVTLLTMQVTLLAPYAAYATGFPRVVAALDWGLSALLSGILVYVNLRLATHLQRPALAAAVFIGLLFVLAYGVEWLGEEQFLPYPADETLLKPPFAKLRASLELDEYEGSIEALIARLAAEGDGD